MRKAGDDVGGDIGLYGGPGVGGLGGCYAGWSWGRRGIGGKRREGMRYIPCFWLCRSEGGKERSEIAGLDGGEDGIVGDVLVVGDYFFDGGVRCLAKFVMIHGHRLDSRS